VQTYLLPEHVHVCSVQTDAVFLNVRTDEYFGLDRDQSRTLGMLLKGWETSSASSAFDDEQAQHLANSLLSRGLLSVQSGRSVTPLPIRPARYALLPWDAMSPTSVRALHVLRFARSFAVARYLMRFSRFEQVIGRVRSMREESATELSRGSAEELLSAFYHIRPFFYGKAGKCLLDSLVLALFLSCYGFLPRWIIGVRTRPFGAHCWLQHEDLVFNGTPEYVRAYTPILAI
jgi:hypothetical protein